MAVSIAIFFDTRRIKKKTGTYPIKLRVTHERITNFYPTIYNLSQEDYDKLSATRLNAELQEVRAKLQEIERTSKNAAKELDPFSFDEFEKDYIVNNSLFEQKKYNTPVVSITRANFDFNPFHKKFPILIEPTLPSGTIGSVYIPFIKNLLIEGRIGTASKYHSSYV